VIVGLGDADGPAALGPDESCCSTPEKRRRQALKQLGRAHFTGALARVAAGGGGDQLGGLNPNDWVPPPGEVDDEEAAFDGRLNAWLVDYQAAYAKLPKPLTQQIDDFVARWRARSTFWIISKRKAEMVIGFEAEFNRFVDQVTAAGHPSSVAPATVSVDGVEYRADQIPPPPPGTFDRIESIVKWGGIVVGGVALYKVASELGLVARLGRLVGGGGGGGGGVRRYGSAKRR
jgi:hypothetical protein